MKEKFNVTFGSYSGTRTDVTVDLPPSCPHCGRLMKPIFISGASDQYISSSERHFGLLLRCSYDDCAKFYALQYKYLSNNQTEIVEFSYSPPINIDIPNNISVLSENFTETYQQSAVAESLHLDKVAGVGYRKSAEILYKDYAILKNPNDEDKIKRMPLKAVIDAYMNDFPKIQSLATSVAYIGNDETHYERRNKDKDVQDLKKFLISSIKWIDADLDVDESDKFIN